MVYVDALQEYPEKPFGHRKWAHLWADSEEELHAFAQSIGLQRAWFQADKFLNHYDVVPSKWTLAWKQGAQLTTILAWLEAKGEAHD